MSFGIVAASVITGGIAAYGANKANKQAQNQWEAQLDMYYDSPQYKSGTKATDYLLGTTDQADFDEAAYLAANPDVAEFIKLDPDKANKYWGGTTGYDHWKTYGRDEGRMSDDYFKDTKKTKGLLEIYIDEALKPMPAGMKNVSDYANDWMGKPQGEGGYIDYIGKLSSVNDRMMGTSFGNSPQAKYSNVRQRLGLL